MTSAASDSAKLRQGLSGGTTPTNDSEVEGTVVAVTLAVSRGRWRDNEDVRHPWERACRPPANIPNCSDSWLVVDLVSWQHSRQNLTSVFYRHKKKQVLHSLYRSKKRYIYFLDASFFKSPPRGSWVKGHFFFLRNRPFKMMPGEKKLIGLTHVHHGNDVAPVFV